MPRANVALADLCEPDFLHAAAAAATRGKRRRPDAAWFWFRREAVLARLARELASGAFRPGPFELFFLRDPKPRVIARASIEDRLVHAALARLLGPPILRSARDEDVGCRPGGGVHLAWLRLLESLRRHRFALHLDVRAYFPSIRPEIVLRQLGRFVDDRPLLALVESILERGRGLYDSPRARRHARLAADWPPLGRGLPMGAATSQIFAAHLHLQGLDHFVKRELRAPAYLRYADDLFLFGDRRADLRAWRGAVAAHLCDELDLRLKHPRARVLACAGHLDALGARIRREGIEPSPRACRALRGRLGRFVRGGPRAPSAEAMRRSLSASAGWLLFG